MYVMHASEWSRVFWGLWFGTSQVKLSIVTVKMQIDDVASNNVFSGDDIDGNQLGPQG